MNQLILAPIAVFGLFLCILIILFEYLWLSVLAERQDSQAKKAKELAERIDGMLKSILYYPTQNVLETEMASLERYVDQDAMKMDYLATCIVDWLVSDDTNDEQKMLLCTINDRIRPLEYFENLLKTGNTYEKAYACRKLAIFGADEHIGAIRKLSYARNRDLAYNAAMALSVFGDEKPVFDFILRAEKHYDYSHRIILELFDAYGGDLRSLSRRLLEEGNEYIRSSVIKGISDRGFTDFVPLFLDGLNSKQPNLQIACIRALGHIGNPDHQRALITAAHDKVWQVRSSAVKELGRINTPQTKQALLEAVKDSEWWVRYNAARTLIQIDTDFEYVEQVLNGYDRYAADMMKYVLYRYYSRDSLTDPMKGRG